ncbi:MAG: hypothetical protein ACI9WC_001058 [Arenicella sp.]|jgi:uncharacterized protein YcfJ
MKTTNTTNINSKLRNTTKALIVAGVVAGVSLPVAANKYRGHNDSAFDYAKVVDVTPAIETYEVNNPVEQCWDEKIRHNTGYSDRGYNDRGRSSHTGEIFGALIGAAVGNKVGSGRGKKVATVAGAILGGSIARDIKNGDRRSNSRNSDRYAYQGRGGYETVQRCELRDSITTQERVVGFDVAYKYRGNVFNTQMNQRPGDKIKVKVTVKPV